MDTAERIRVTGDELLARARALIPNVRERAAGCASARRVPAESIAAFHEAGLFDTLKPRRFGGHELELIEFIRIAEEVSRACGSTGWVYSVLTSHAVWIATFPEEGQQEVWSDPRALACSAFMPTAKAEPVEGGFRISGRWPFASGCDHAKWALLGFMEGQTFWVALIEMKDLTVVDDWHVLGLAGTGSKTLVGEGIFVPHRRTVTLAEATAGTSAGLALHEGPLYKCPRYSCSPYTLLAPAIGIAQGAVDDFCAEMAAKTSRGQRVAMLEGVQLKLSESAAEVDAARLIAHRNCLGNAEDIRRDGALTLQARARNRRDQSFAVKLCLSAVDRLHAASGAHGLYQDNRVGQAFRDVHAAAAHVAFNWEMAAKPYGQLRLGLAVDPAETFLL
jgi:alkylation response protein AidB-like acyl-CoA dehydrogenase